MTPVQITTAAFEIWLDMLQLARCNFTGQKSSPDSFEYITHARGVSIKGYLKDNMRGLFFAAMLL